DDMGFVCRAACAVLALEMSVKLGTFGGEAFPTVVELFPHCTILAGCVAEAAAPATTNGWIEAGKIYAFHRKCAWSSTDQLGQFDDLWIVSMQLAERRLAVKVERQLKLFPRPVLARKRTCGNCQFVHCDFVLKAKSCDDTLCNSRHHRHNRWL